MDYITYDIFIILYFNPFHPKAHCHLLLDETQKLEWGLRGDNNLSANRYLFLLYFGCLVYLQFIVQHGF